VDSLLGKRTKAKVISTLDSLSKGSGALDDAYNEAIGRIDGQLLDDSALAKRALSWISYAQRPLTTGELCHALAVELEDEELDQDNILDVEDIVSVCAGLVTVDEESEVIRLVHYTTQDYLEKIRGHWNPNAQYDIASTCLTYLCFNTFRSGSCVKDAEFETRIEQNMFLDYSARYWGQHVATVQEQVCELAMRLLQEDNLVACALQVSMVPRYKFLRYSQKFPHQATGLHIAASLGLLHVAEGVLTWYENEKASSADSRDGSGATPLSLAAQNGHEAVVKLLLERDDVEADSKDNEGQTPLSWAVIEGHEAVVKLLLERDDVEADSKDIGGRTPLSQAVKRGHEAVVKLLLERDDVDADSKDDNGLTPLWQAVKRGHEAIVKLLLERDDVEADLKDNQGQTPLSWAAFWGRDAEVKLLLERDDVEADSKDSRGQTPLSWAAVGGQEAVIKLLLERDDVEADSKDDGGRTPLSWATEKGHEAVVELFTSG
jgi:ankyrin repeat protein